MMRVPSGIAPIVLRSGAVVLLIVGQSRVTPGPGLHGTGLAVTVLIAALAATLLFGVLIPLFAPAGSRHATEDPAGTGRGEPEGRAGRLGGLWRNVSAPVRHRQVLGVSIPLISLALGVVLAIVLDAIAPSGPATAVLLFCVAAAVARHPLSQAAVVGLLAVAGLAVTGALSGAPARDLTLMLGVCLIFLVSYSVRQRRAARAAEAREAVLGERARIAREIHDILAHSLSAQVVHLEGAKLLLRAERTDEALDRVTRARDLAKTGLEEARRAVSALREDAPALPDALRSLAEEFESLTHQPCSLRVTGPEHHLPPETELTLLRTAQEALTNVRRHAPGSRAEIELAFDRTGCALLVTNPASEEKGTPGGGYGLVGMRERAELLGGTLSAGEQDGRFQVRLKVPA
ncbi:MAG: sensor histidine kinase [Nonomuraea sp.]|nr:sensor histidine kinase [Nonomuraea sp.]NUP61795.1 sensor histidine kinase [Nonomuraea sp.]NUS02690.1 sensor histidine kinase [Nonomuraea sp.]